LQASVSSVLNDSREPKINDLHDWSAERKPRQRTLEIWYGTSGY
jgi:hypothetical protein